jgi:hypothetical protein
VPTRRVRSVLLLVLGLALAVLAGACDGGGDPGARVADAQQATLDAGSAAFTIDQELTGGQADGTITSSGELDFANQRGRVQVELPGLGGEQGVETLFDGDTVYLRLPEGAAPTPWVRLDLEDAEGIPGLESLEDLTNDPSRNLSFLEGVTGEVEEVGEEEVRGVPATHYRLTVDLQRAVEEAPEEDRAFLQQQIDTLGVTELPTEVWLDEEGRIVRQSYTLDLEQVELPSAAEGADAQLSGQVATVIEYFDFGTEVEVEPPPAEEVTDFAELMGGGAGSAAPTEGG